MKEHVVLVTGAGRGIGRAIAEGFARLGCRVAITARTRSELNVTADNGKRFGGTMLPIVADLTEEAAAAYIFDAVIGDFGRLDILVNNAGIGSSIPDGSPQSRTPQPIVDFDDAFWQRTMAINVTAPFRLTKLALRGMMERRWGRVINVASVNASLPALHAAAYTASKHALAGLTKVTAIEVAGFGVTANAICPSTTRSRLNDRRLEYESARLGVALDELERNSTPLGRRLEPEEVAGLALFLAGDAAAAINGQSINVCGGRVFS
jgi:NAD(P)-dependent dehydrogenase (short-subunit alcohol dehydrogenase family)